MPAATDTVQVIAKVRPCCDEWCWRSGKAEDCAKCDWGKAHPNPSLKEDTREEGRRNVA